MELVKKQIYLNPYISRHFSLIPYVVKDANKQDALHMGDTYIDIETFSENGNYGCYPYDVDIQRCGAFVTHTGDEVSPINLNLRQYFTSEKVTFKELSDKFAILRKIINASNYYEAISKNGKMIWVERELTFAEKLNVEIVNYLPSDGFMSGSIYGVYNNNSYAENGGRNMLLFLFKAMGMFVVDPIYVKDNNCVPEVMYYTGIKYYLQKMDKVKDSDNCCVKNEYEYLGGDTFYGYLKYKLSEIEQEINYWFLALYREKGVLTEPVIHMSLGLNEECYNIGNYIPIPDTTGSTEHQAPNNDYLVRTLVNESPLKTLRRTTITYCEEYIDDRWVTKEFPLILDEENVNENGVAGNYKLNQPYDVGYPKNLSCVDAEMGYYYGDMIYQMDFLQDYVHIYYVIGGLLRLNNGKWEYIHKGNNSESLLDIVSFLKQPQTGMTVDDYLFIKDKLNDFTVNTTLYENDEIYFKGNVLNRSEIVAPSTDSNEIWVYRINFRNDIKKQSGGNEPLDRCYVGDFVIVSKNSVYLLNHHRVSNSNFSGIRYYEKKQWEPKSYKDGTVVINMLFENKRTGFNNILEDESIVVNVANVKHVYYINMDEEVEGVFVSNEFANEDLTQNILIMNDYDFGKTEMIVENSQDILIDRGFVSTFELHYKLSEINTMEDMENYGNNFFGL